MSLFIQNLKIEIRIIMECHFHDRILDLFNIG